MKDIAIVFSVNDAYSFALGNVLMSLKENSRYIYNQSDFFVYHDGILDKNKNILNNINADINYINFSKDKFLPEEIYSHAHLKRWGLFIYQKFRAFQLSKKYEHILWLDADILIQDDIDYIFNQKSDMAWRDAVIWKLGASVEESFIPRDYPGCNGGVIYFHRNTNIISNNDIVDAYKKVSNVPPGGGLY